MCVFHCVNNRYPGLVALQRGSAVSPRAHSPRSEQLTPRRAAVTQLKWKLHDLDTRIATADSSDTAAALEAERSELVKAYDHVIAAGATCSPSGASLPRSPRAGGISPRGSSSTVGADSSVSVGFGTGYTPPPAVLLQSPPAFGKRAATATSSAATTAAGSYNSVGAMQQPPPPMQPRPTAAIEQRNSTSSNRSSISSSSSSSAAVDTSADTNNATKVDSGSNGVIALPPRSPRASQQASPQSSVGGAASVASASSTNTANSAANNTAAGTAIVTTAGTADMLPSPGKLQLEVNKQVLFHGCGWHRVHSTHSYTSLVSYVLGIEPCVGTDFRLLTRRSEL
jgi:hypothetical protein